jgi:hypothetical protein
MARYVAGIVLIGIALSYALARAGEPQSVWLWCSVFHACGAE